MLRNIKNKTSNSLRRIYIYEMKNICIILIYWLIIQHAQADDNGCFKPYKLKYNNRNVKHTSFSFTHNDVKQTKSKTTEIETEPSGCISFGTTLKEGYFLLYSFENQLSPSIYLDNDIGLSYYGVSGYNPNDITNKYPQYYTGNVLGVHASINPRWSFMQDYRTKKGKSTNFNSGEFIGLKAAFTYTPRFQFSQSVYSIAPNIGFRRTFIDRGLFEISLGMAYTNRKIIDSSFAGSYNGMFIPELNIRIGCLLYK